MSMDWTNIYYDQLKGEKHLLIMPNSEHSLATGIYGVLESIGTFVRSVAGGKTEAQRPTFSYQYDAETGQLSVTVPKDQE